MSVKTARNLVTRVMRAAIKETMSPANQGTKEAPSLPPLSEAGSVSRQFGRELQRCVDAYTGSVDEFGSSTNTVDNWRLQFSRRSGGLKAANNGIAGDRKRPA